MDQEKHEIYPLTLTVDRYSGAYSGGSWTAWNCEPTVIPEAIFGDDVSCCEFWSGTTMAIGIGDTPEAAIKDLEKKLYSLYWE